jgi:tetratricopeptide (TPR) repeat protein
VAQSHGLPRTGVNAKQAGGTLSGRWRALKISFRITKPGGALETMSPAPGSGMTRQVVLKKTSSEDSTWRTDVRFEIRTCLALLIIPVVLSGCGGKEERKAMHMEKGKTYYEQANYDKARVELKNALQIDPKTPEAYYMIGLIEEEQKNWRNAFGNYVKTVELNPDHKEAKIRLGRLYLFSGDTNKAEQIVSEVFAKKPGDIAGSALNAAIMARKGDVPGAIGEASRVVAADAAQSDAVSLLAGLYARQKEDAKAQEVLEKGVKASPKNISLRMDLALVLVKRNDLDKAEQQFKDVIAIEPKKLGHRVALATFYSTLNKLDEAEKTLRGAIQADEDDEQRYLLLAEFLANNKKSPEQAEKELLRVIEAKPKVYQLRINLGKLYEAMNAPEKAQQTYRDVIAAAKIRPEGLRARTQLAQSLIASRNTAEAEKLVAEVLKENPKDIDALQLRGQMSLAKGDAKQSIADLRDVMKDRPDSVEIVTLLAIAHLKNNEPQLARDVFNNAIERYPNNPNLRLALADFLVSTKDYDGALKAADAVLNADPRTLRAFQVKADIQAAKKDWSAAEETMTNLKAALPEQPVGYYRLGMIYQAEKKYDQAIAEFEMALKTAPNAIEPLKAIVDILVAQGKADKAIIRVNQSLQAHPGNFMAQSLLGAVYSSQNKYPEAEAAFRKVIQLNQKAAGPYLDLANLYLSHGDVKKATQTLQQGVGAVPGDLRLPAALAETYQRAGDNDKAIAEYENILTKSPETDVVANNLASLLTEAKGDKANLERALDLAKRFENASNPLFLDTLGWVYFKLGQYGRALPPLQKVVEKAPEVPIFQYHLGMTLYKQGDLKSAKIHLQQAVDAKGSFFGVEEARGILATM